MVQCSIQQILAAVIVEILTEGKLISTFSSSSYLFLLIPSCCLPYHNQQAVPPTPIQVVRSRFSAFKSSKLDYIISTTAPSHQVLIITHSLLITQIFMNQLLTYLLRIGVVRSKYLNVRSGDDNLSCLQKNTSFNN